MKRVTRRPPKDYLLALLLVVVIGYLAVGVVDIYTKQKIARETAEEERREMKELEARYAMLKENLEDLDTARGQERAYREQFGVARPGEEVIIVVSPEEEAPQTGLTWWRKVLGWFGL